MKQPTAVIAPAVILLGAAMGAATGDGDATARCEKAERASVTAATERIVDGMVG